MERRKFLSLLGMSAAGLALDQVIPFNRVWSFPKEIVKVGVDYGYDDPQFFIVSTPYSLEPSYFLRRYLYEMEAQQAKDWLVFAGDRWPSTPAGRQDSRP